MIQAFYTGTNATIANQKYLDVISNNMANIQTDGYKREKAEFADLLYVNIREPENIDSDAKMGVGSRIVKTDVVFEPSPLSETGKNSDFALTGDGFFAVQNVDTDEVFFTRAGSFSIGTIDEETYLMFGDNYVLDADEEPIVVENNDVSSVFPGVFLFENNNMLEKVGDSLFRLRDEATEYEVYESPGIIRSYVESSGVEYASEVVKLIQTQRAFQINAKLITTADEIEQTINSLKN